MIQEEITLLIEKLLTHDYVSEKEGDKIINQIVQSVVFCKDIINIIYWGNENLSATEILLKAEQKHKAIIL